MKRALTLVVILLVVLLVGLLSWSVLIKRNRTSPSDAVQIHLLGTNSAGQLQFWATNRSDSRVHVALRDVQVKREQAWVTDQHLLNPGRQFVLDPYSATHGVLTFSKPMPLETWRLGGMTADELDGAPRLVEYAKLKLEDLRTGTTSNIPTTPAQGGPFFKNGYLFYIECNTNGIGSAPAVGISW